MRTKNDITGDPLVTKPSSNVYRDGWDRIFGKKKEEPVVVPQSEVKIKKPKKAAPKGLHVQSEPKAKSKGK